MDDFLTASLFLLFMGGVVFSWVDWRRRMKKLPARAGPSWSCPNCSLVNEGDQSICWSCGAGVSLNLFGVGPAQGETWRCPTCRSWNGRSRRSCWSCSHVPGEAPKRPA